MNRQTHNLDATGQPLGRLASRIAVLLRGKHKANFLPRLDQGDQVEVVNVDQIKITGKKLEQKIYQRYSGYPSGVKSQSLGELVAARGYGEALKRAVWNMLPKNKTREEIIKRLIIKN